MSIPLAVFFYGLFYLVINVIIGRQEWLYPVFTGFLSGYIIYDMLHYSLHHSKAKSGYFAMCRYQHMQHHGTCPSMRFGVTSPVWDYVFGTMPKTTKKAS
jgi:sterol desaturase/sphingolipid hydroxylase (fatty acid hydroxylase superfamily)